MATEPGPPEGPDGKAAKRRAEELAAMFTAPAHIVHGSRVMARALAIAPRWWRITATTGYVWPGRPDCERGALGVAFSSSDRFQPGGFKRDSHG